MVDLKDDEELISEYEKLHSAVWPEVEAIFREHGVLGIDIYRLGTRLCMIMETEPDFDFDEFSKAQLSDAKTCEWEELMWKFQAAAPWTPEGEKWAPAKRIYQYKE